MSSADKKPMRKRIADSEWLNNAVAGLLARYVAFCHWTTRWDRDGFDELRSHLQSGEPAVMCLWHQRLLMAPYLFDLETAPICTLNSTARAGRMGGRIVEKLGFEVEAMDPGATSVAVTRSVLKRIANGYSVGMTTDGSHGPPRISKTHPILWARASGKPIFTVAYASRRVLKLPTWDKMHLPLPFTRGALLVRRFDHDIPRKMSGDALEALRNELDIALDAVTDAADRRAGRKSERP
ncbi:MAG: DUF374 domain-containing protein [Rhodobacteraceae bacterium]|nr:DUF374 domain-containing protein [Paracoccaceae bacterium]